MTKITVKPHREGETPSQQIVNASNEEFTVVDARGRTIALKKPGVVAQLRLVGAIGEENDRYVGMATIAFWVTSIDGAPAPAPTNKTQVEALFARLDEDGLTAVSESIGSRFGLQDKGADLESLKK